MKTFEDWKDPYALVRFYGYYSYGHMEATVYNAIPEAYRCPKIVISCQVGHGNDFSDKDTMFEKPYAERWGIEGRDSDITTLQDMELIVLLMRRIDRRLTKLSNEMGYPPQLRGLHVPHPNLDEAESSRLYRVVRRALEWQHGRPAARRDGQLVVEQRPYQTA